MPIPKYSSKAALLLALCITCLMPGCVPWARGLRTIDETVTDWRDFVWGKRAFFQRYGKDSSGPFMDGFLEGYHDMLQGGDGCLPVVPPRRYWNWKYQSAGGQGAVNDWFNGYSAGVTAAREDGLANLYRVPVSSQYNGANEVPIQPVPSGTGEDWVPFEETVEPSAIPSPTDVEPGKSNAKDKGAFFFRQPDSGSRKGRVVQVAREVPLPSKVLSSKILPANGPAASSAGDRKTSPQVPGTSRQIQKGGEGMPSINGLPPIVPFTGNPGN